MTKKQLKETLQRRINYLKNQRAENLKEAEELDKHLNYEEADIKHIIANNCLARISECEMILNNLD